MSRPACHIDRTSDARVRRGPVRVRHAAGMALLSVSLLAPLGCATKRQVTWETAVNTSPARAASPDPGAHTHHEHDAHGARGPGVIEHGAVDAYDAPPPPPPGQGGPAFGGPAEKRVTDLGKLPESSQAGLLIDRSLAAFRSRRAAEANMRQLPGMRARTWRAILQRIDAACQLEPEAGDLGAFIRARVTLEAEYELDMRKKRILDADIEPHIAHSIAFIDDRVQELRLMGAPGALKPAARLHDGPLVFSAPLREMRVTSPFGVRTDPITGKRRFHAGVDYGAPFGTMVYSAAGGLVVFAGWQGGYGKHVVIDHGDGMRTHYSHLQQIYVEPGMTIDNAYTIGTVGSTGRSTGPHLHFAITNAQGRFVNPVRMLGTPVPAAKKPTHVSQR